MNWNLLAICITAILLAVGNALVQSAARRTRNRNNRFNMGLVPVPNGMPAYPQAPNQVRPSLVRQSGRRHYWDDDGNYLGFDSISIEPDLPPAPVFNPALGGGNRPPGG